MNTTKRSTAEMMNLIKSGAGLAKWAEDIHAAGKHVYWWGTYCNACTDNLLSGKTRQYPAQYGDSRQATYRKHIQQGKTATDCVGLIKGYYWEKDGVIKYGRDGLPDKGANGMYKATTIKGKIATLPEIPGALVWTKSRGHVAVYVGGGYVVEARGFAYGVQRNKLSARNFTDWGLCPYVPYTAEEVEKAKTAMIASGVASGVTSTANGVRSIRKGDSGEDVREMQKMLVKAGATLPRYGVDGDCGDETVAAIKAFQTANGLVVDGIYGALTRAKLEAATGSTAQKPTESKPTTDKPTIRKGDKGDAVRRMQTALVRAGCNLPLFGIDGDCGDETVAAIKAFQVSHSLTPDGVCGVLTWAQLDKV